MTLFFRARRVSRVGGVAQLGEHLLCKQGVIGSIPIVSTTIVCKQTMPTTPPSSGDNRLSSNDESRFACKLRGSPAATDGGSSIEHWLYRGMSEFGLIVWLRQSVLGCVVVPFVLPGWVALFFVRVNQVLVRLWARVTRNPSSDGSRVPSFNRIV
jgi:hypothetical protein